MEEKKEKKQFSKKWIVIILVILLGAFCGVLYVDQVSGQGKLLDFFIQSKGETVQEEKKSEEVETGEPEEAEEELPQGKYISLDADAKASFLPMESGFYMCTKDGVKCYTDMETQKWSETFTMGNPVMVQEGSYLAVGDLSGNTVRVYGKEGFLYETHAEGSLGYFAINESGFLGVINRGEAAYGVTIYDNTGKKRKGRVEESTGVYPLSLDISADGRVFAVSYLDTTDIEVMGRVLYFYIDPKEGEKFADSMFAAVEKEGEVLTKVGFMENGILAVISDRNVYGFGAAGTEKWKVALENRVDQVVFADQKYLILAYGEKISGEEAKAVGTVVWIDGNGKVESEFSAEGKIDYFSGSKTGAVVGVGRKYYGLRTGGKEVWEHTARQEISDILMLEKETKVLYVTATAAQICQTNSEQWSQKSNTDATEKVVTKYQVVPSETKKAEKPTGGTEVEGKAEEVSTNTNEETEQKTESEEKTKKQE